MINCWGRIRGNMKNKYLFLGFAFVVMLTSSAYAMQQFFGGFVKNVGGKFLNVVKQGYSQFERGGDVALQRAKDVQKATRITFRGSNVCRIKTRIGFLDNLKLRELACSEYKEVAKRAAHKAWGERQPFEWPIIRIGRFSNGETISVRPGTRGEFHGVSAEKIYLDKDGKLVGTKEVVDLQKVLGARFMNRSTLYE